MRICPMLYRMAKPASVAAVLLWGLLAVSPPSIMADDDKKAERPAKPPRSSDERPSRDAAVRDELRRELEQARRQMAQAQKNLEAAEQRVRSLERRVEEQEREAAKSREETRDRADAGRRGPGPFGAFGGGDWGAMGRGQALGWGFANPEMPRRLQELEQQVRQLRQELDEIRRRLPGGERPGPGDRRPPEGRRGPDGEGDKAGERGPGRGGERRPPMPDRRP